MGDDDSDDLRVAIEESRKAERLGWSAIVAVVGVLVLTVAVGLLLWGAVALLLAFGAIGLN